MSLNSSQGFITRLVADGVQLDLFKDEIITVSNNVTGLFDVGLIPSEFTRQILIPGTKKNNEFFKHCYDISVDNPYLFATNVKIPAYFDFDGLYITQGYLQLNKINVKSNRFVESYEVSIYGTISSFSRDINRYYLTDLSNLSVYNHTSSYENIVNSWDKNLFSGSIVYPFADYGSGWTFLPGDLYSGIDANEGAVTVQDFKPAIRVRDLLDKVFEFTGYQYSSSFFNESWWDDVYMICNNSLKYPEYVGVDMENFGVAKWGAISGSGMTDWNPGYNTIGQLPWYNTIQDPTVVLGENNSYKITKESALQGELDIQVNVSSSLNEAVTMELHYWPTGSTPGSYYTTLVNFNTYFTQYQQANTGGGGVNNNVNLKTKFVTSKLPVGNWYFGIRYTSTYGSAVVTFDKGGQPKSSIKISKVLQAADDRVMNMQLNMPYGQTGIKLVDFIKSLQKKFNLVIYPDRTKLNQFIIEPFNYWYNKGKVKNFDKYIDLNQAIEVIPANNLAVNKLEFGDKLGGDYLTQQFQKENIREYGKTYYVDTQNLYSQGDFKVETAFEVSPLTKVPNSGASGSASNYNPGGGGTYYTYYVGNQGWYDHGTACTNTSYFPNVLYADTPYPAAVTTLYTDSALLTPFNGGYSYWKIVSQNYGSQYYSLFITQTGDVQSVAQCTYNGANIL